MKKKTEYKKKIILFGGNRLLENGPIGDLIEYFKKKKINFLLITNPDHLKKKTSNNKSFEETIKGAKYLSFKKFNDKKVLKLIDKNSYGLSINARWKFSRLIIKKFNGRFFNYHAANLPGERGSGCLTWKMLQKNFKRNFINIHKIAEEFDTGDIVSSKKIIFKNKNFLPRDYLKLTRSKEQSFLINFVNKIMGNQKIVAKKQKGEEFYWPSLNADIDGKIDWSWNVEDIVLFIKSFSHPYNGAYSFINSNKIRVFDARFLKKRKFHPFQNGLIFRESDKEICIANKTGHIIVKKNNLSCQKIQKTYLGKRFL